MSWEVGDDEWLTQPSAAPGSGPVDALDDRVIRSLTMGHGAHAQVGSERAVEPVEAPVEAYALTSDDLPPPPYSAAFDADQETPSYESGSFVAGPEEQEPKPALDESGEAAEPEFHIPTLSLSAMTVSEPEQPLSDQVAAEPQEATAEPAPFVIPTLSVTSTAETEQLESVEEVGAEELEEVEELESQPVGTGDTVVARASEPEPSSITEAVYDEDEDDASSMVIPELVERVDSSELEVVLEDPSVESEPVEPPPPVTEPTPEVAATPEADFVIPTLARPEPTVAESEPDDDVVIPSSLLLRPSDDAADDDPTLSEPEREAEIADTTEELQTEELQEVDAEAIESLDSADLEELEQPVTVAEVVEPVEAKPPTPPEVKPPPKRRKAWYDDVFAEHFLFLYPLTWEATCERDAQFIFSLIGGQEGSTILDVGCGDGRHAVELAKLGARVTGLDNSLALLLAAAQTKDSAELEEDRVEFIHGDMRRLPRDREFDAVICVGTTLGYFEEEQNWLCLQEMHDRLRPGGRLLIHVFNRDFIAPQLPSRSWWQGKRCMVIDEAEMNFFANRLRVHRTIIFDDGRQYEHYMFMRAYTVQDLGKAISQLGMRVLEVAGSRDTRGRFYGSASPDIWIVAEKK